MYFHLKTKHTSITTKRGNYQNTSSSPHVHFRFPSFHLCHSHPHDTETEWLCVSIKYIFLFKLYLITGCFYLGFGCLECKLTNTDFVFHWGLGFFFLALAVLHGSLCVVIIKFWLFIQLRKGLRHQPFYYWF